MARSKDLGLNTCGESMMGLAAHSSLRLAPGDSMLEKTASAVYIYGRKQFMTLLGEGAQCPLSIFRSPSQSFAA